jgi:putative heme degradation protein
MFTFQPGPRMTKLSAGLNGPSDARFYASAAGAVVTRANRQRDSRMNTSARIEIALQNLAAAIDLLEAACEGRIGADTERNDLREEFAVLQDDRTRLGIELDAAVARSKSLELANDEVARRLQKASAAIRSMLAHAEIGEH